MVVVSSIKNKKVHNTSFTLPVNGYEVQITNPEKPLWPQVTKWMYLEKLIQLSPYLLKYCENRYLTTIRYPHGIADKSFYQKNCPQPAPEYVQTHVWKDVNYINLNNLPTLLWLGNLASLEFHPSFHYIDSDLPVEWVIDIDPSQQIEPRIMQAALIVGDTLHSLNIQSVPKTSGATGVQIIVPIKLGDYTFDQLRQVGHFLSTYLVNKHPDLFTIERLKKHRGQHIYLDYLQHWEGKTLSAPYTPRAREEATVSTPLLWQEVELSPDPRDFTLLNIQQRLQQKGDILSQVPPQNMDKLLEACT